MIDTDSVCFRALPFSSFRVYQYINLTTRFGLFICFDMMWSQPAVDLVMKYNVTNLAFPTAWIDALPTLSATGFHPSFARRFGINVLAANMHYPRGGYLVCLLNITLTGLPKLVVSESPKALNGYFKTMFGPQSLRRTPHPPWPT